MCKLGVKSKECVEFSVKKYNGRTFQELVELGVNQRELMNDCHFCKLLKGCKNPNSKGHTEQPKNESLFFTCAVYEYNPEPHKQKPKKKQPYFNPERIAALNWALEAIA